MPGLSDAHQLIHELACSKHFCLSEDKILSSLIEALPQNTKVNQLASMLPYFSLPIYHQLLHGDLSRFTPIFIEKFKKVINGLSQEKLKSGEDLRILVLNLYSQMLPDPNASLLNVGGSNPIEKLVCRLLSTDQDFTPAESALLLLCKQHLADVFMPFYGWRLPDDGTKNEAEEINALATKQYGDKAYLKRYFLKKWVIQLLDQIVAGKLTGEPIGLPNGQLLTLVQYISANSIADEKVQDIFEILSVNAEQQRMTDDVAFFVLSDDKVLLPHLFKREQFFALFKSWFVEALDSGSVLDKLGAVNFSGIDNSDKWTLSELGQDVNGLTFEAKRVLYHFREGFVENDRLAIEAGYFGESEGVIQKLQDCIDGEVMYFTMGKPMESVPVAAKQLGYLITSNPLLLDKLLQENPTVLMRMCHVYPSAITLIEVFSKRADSQGALLNFLETQVLAVYKEKFPSSGMHAGSAMFSENRSIGLRSTFVSHAMNGFVRHQKIMQTLVGVIGLINYLDFSAKCMRDTTYYRRPARQEFISELLACCNEADETPELIEAMTRYSNAVEYVDKHPYQTYKAEKSRRPNPELPSMDEWDKYCGKYCEKSQKPCVIM